MQGALASGTSVCGQRRAKVIGTAGLPLGCWGEFVATRGRFILQNWRRHPNKRCRRRAASNYLPMVVAFQCVLHGCVRISIKLRAQDCRKISHHLLVLLFVNVILVLPRVKHARTVAGITLMQVELGAEGSICPADSQMLAIPRPPLRIARSRCSH